MREFLQSTSPLTGAARTTGQTPPPFRSFWQGGFESACHINGSRTRMDLIAATQHDARAGEDYALLRAAGLRVARDGVRWPLIDRGGRYDFATLEPLARAARAHGVQVIWNLCHYGWPDDLDVFSAAFVDRFARYCGAVARYLREQGDDIPFYAPVNEISFLAWAVGRAGFIHPYARGRDDELKRQLVRAAVAGCDAVWGVDPRARIVHVDPIFHVVPPRGRPDLHAAAAAQRASQWEAWDMLAGRRDRELGGAPRYLDVVGVNYYHANQWEHPDVRLRWEDDPRDERWLPFRRLLEEAHARYHRPLLVAETGHFGVGRAAWLREVAGEVAAARRGGVPVEGVCLYPVIDRPDWENPDHWHHSGLWDLVPDAAGRLRRVLVEEYAAELRRWQRLIPHESQRGSQ